MSNDASEPTHFKTTNNAGERGGVSPPGLVTRKP